MGLGLATRLTTQERAQKYLVALMAATFVAGAAATLHWIGPH
jgi:hypothetical protein